MRGIAAFAVVLSHAADNVAASDQTAAQILQSLCATPLRAMFNGRYAVIFFFVLSGWVLTRSLLVEKPPGYLVFVLRRIMRLCVPTAAALILSAALYWACHSTSPWPDPTVWFANAGWTRVPWPSEIIRQALMIGADGDFYLDGVVWSLVHELRFSLLLPLVVLVSARGTTMSAATMLLASGAMLFGIQLSETEPQLVSIANIVLPLVILCVVVLRTEMHRAWSVSTGTLAFLACCVLAGVLIGRQMGNHERVMLGRDEWESLLATFYFLPTFLIGAALAVGALDRFVLRPNHRYLCLGCALLLLCYDNLFAIVGASVLLIRLAQQPSGLQTLLRTGFLVFLGRISFSLYLVHVPVYLALGHTLHDVLPKGAIVALGIVLSVPSAWILYRVAEHPAQRFARRIQLEMPVKFAGR